MASPFAEEKAAEFSHAVRRGNLPLVQALSLDPEVDLNWKDRFGWAPLFYACDRGHVEIVHFLLDFKDNNNHKEDQNQNQNERRVDFNLANHSGWTPFWMACYKNHAKVIEMLLADERIDVNMSSYDGLSPLWIASSWGHVAVVKLLLALGGEIDLGKRDQREEKTAWEISVEYERKEIVELLGNFQREPLKIRFQLRRELGYSDRKENPLCSFLHFFSIFNSSILQSSFFFFHSLFFRSIFSFK